MFNRAHRFRTATVSRTLASAFCLLVWSSAAAGAAPARADVGGDNAYYSWLSAPGAALIVPSMDNLDQGEQAWLARRSRLQGPAAVLARQQSRYAYDQLAARGVGRLLSASFPSVVDRSAGADGIPGAARVTRYLSSHAAQIALPGKRDGVLEALHPLARPVGKGHFAAIDLALHASGRGFAPVNPAVDVLIPQRISEGVSAPGDGVSLIPVDSHGRPLGGSPGELDGATVIYANTATASDALAKPTPEGFQLDAALRSVESPQQLRYRVDVPAQSHMVQERPSGAIRIVRGRVTIGSILPPGAQDSAGSSVPVAMALKGSTIVLSVAHRAGSYQYPIEVDPEYNDHQLVKTPSGKRSNWEFKSSNEAIFKHVETYEGSEKEWLETSATSAYKSSEFGFWVYETKGVSKIYELKAETEAKNTGGKIESFLEFEKPGGIQESKELLSTEAEHTTEYSRKAASPLCAVNAEGKQECLPTAGQAKNAVHFQQSATAEGSKFSDRLYQGIVSISEPAGTHATSSFGTSPEVEFEVENEGKKEIQKRKNALNGGAWLSKFQGALELIAEDAGIGVSDTKLEYENVPGKWEQLSEHNYLEKENACQGVQCYPRHTEAWTLDSKLPNGEDKIRYRAEEAMSETKSLESEGQTTVKVDTAAPGELSINGLPYGDELSERAYKLTGEATDGEGSTASSGVASIALFVHGHELTRIGGTGKCSVAKGPCTATGEWTINGSELGAGHDEIVLVAFDNAGNEARLPETLTVRHSSPVALGPGSVDLESGNFSLGATDVSVGSGLTVSRVYSSRNLAAGEEGPLGPQWTLNLGSSSSLRELIDGAAIVTGANGGQTIFASLGEGKFQAPTGDSNLTLTLEENVKKEKLAYYLKDATDHTSTKFTLPTGSKTWMPTKQEGTVSTDTLAYKYETVEVAGKKITRPVEALAPVPANVSCEPELKAGCQALKFTYATSTTATGETQSTWGEYTGRLSTVTYYHYNPVAKKMAFPTMIRYKYDVNGRLRSAKNGTGLGTIEPAIYGYDSEGHVTSYQPTGQQPWFFTYGTTAEDAGTGRIMKVSRDFVGAGKWGGELPSNTAPPEITPGVSAPVVGATILADKGAWSATTPLAYGYQWQDCNATGGECKRILGANGATYKVAPSDVGHTLVAQVTAMDTGGAVVASSEHTAEVKAAEVTTYGQGNSEKKLVAITSGPEKALWAADFSASKIYKYSTSGSTLASYSLPVFKGNPEGIAEGSDGNLWITDLANGGNVMKMTPSGSFTEYEMPHESYPHGIVAGPDGNLWLTDSNHSKIDKLTTAGVRTEYSLPAGSAPNGITVGPDGNLWFADKSSNKIGKITTSGTVTEYALPSESSPWGIAAGPDGNLWFTECSASKIGKITTSGAITEYTLPSGSCPRGITSDSINGVLWFAEHGSSKIGIITTAGAVAEYPLTAGTKPGAIALGSDENAWFTTDEGTIELGKINLHLAHEEATAEPSWTVDYKVPISGSGAPYQMSRSSVSAWSQKDDPTEATAIFPPDSPQYWPPSSFTRATIYYLDEDGRIVNTAIPTNNSEYGAISTTEYNEFNDVTRTLSPTNRIAALKAGPEKSVATSKLLDTQKTYNGEGAKEGEVSEPGTRLIDTLEPQHMVKYVAGGKTFESLARNHVKYFYDEEAPGGETYDLVTKTTDLVQLANEEEVEVRKTVTSYAGQEGLGWKLRSPTSVTVDPEGLKITTTTLYNKETGEVTETRGAEGAGGSSAHDSRTIYYSSTENTEGFPSCGLHPEWAGLVCETLPAKQPSGSPAPQLPVTEVTYAELWNKPGKVVEKFSGTTTRTTTYGYDSDGRLTKREVTSNAAEEKTLPKVEFSYSSTTSQLLTIKTATKQIGMKYDGYGRLETYEDGGGNTAQYHYAQTLESDGLLEEISDSGAGKTSRQTYSYDPTTKQLTKLWDSAAGTFTASYGPAGELASETYPNNMCANYTYNAAGEAINVEYIKTTNCTESKPTVWFSESLGVSARGETFSRTNTLGSESYGYDAAHRIAEVQETPTGEGCVSRVYSYNEESNRTKLIRRAPGSKGECTTTGGTSEEHTYDEGNRLTDTGITYDALGNIAKLPAADAEGHELTSTFYVDNAVATQTQNGVTNEYVLDPEGRISETKSGGKTTVSHYDGPGDAVAWRCPESAGKCEEAKETRDIAGIDGTLTAVQTNGELPVLQLHDLQGDVVATASLSSEATKLLSSYGSTEFGVPNAGKTPPKYAWLGAGGVASELSSGVITDGSTSYVPQTGRALESEAVEPPGLPEGSGSGAAYVSQAEAWNMQGAGREAAEAPGLEASRQREAAEKARQAAEKAREAAAAQPGEATEAEWALAEEVFYRLEGKRPKAYSAKSWFKEWVKEVAHAGTSVFKYLLKHQRYNTENEIKQAKKNWKFFDDLTKPEGVLDITLSCGHKSLELVQEIMDTVPPPYNEFSVPTGSVVGCIAGIEGA